MNQPRTGSEINYTEIRHKYGLLSLKTLRKIYGVRFGRGHSDFAQLSAVLPELDEAWLRQLVRDNESGKLQKRIDPGDNV
jgi:hypothetical protein